MGKPQNPYKRGSVYHHNFESHWVWYKDRSPEGVNRAYDEAIAASKNFNWYGWQIMLANRVHANDIEIIARHRGITLENYSPEGVEQ